MSVFENLIPIIKSGDRKKLNGACPSRILLVGTDEAAGMVGADVRQVRHWFSRSIATAFVNGIGQGSRRLLCVRDLVRLRLITVLEWG